MLFRETAALFLCFKTDDVVRVANMHMVEGGIAGILRYMHKCGCGTWKRGSDLLCCVSQFKCLMNKLVLSVTQDMSYNFICNSIKVWAL